jgi:hypothetical protein
MYINSSYIRYIRKAEVLTDKSKGKLDISGYSNFIHARIISPKAYHIMFHVA